MKWGFGRCDDAIIIQTICKVKNRITEVTGTSAANSTAASPNKSDDTATLVNPEGIIMNARGWILDSDNKNINIFAYDEITIFLYGVEVETVGESLFVGGNRIGDMWLVGGTGKRLYALDNNNYDIVSNSNIGIEYMNAGYFEKIVEYDFGETEVNLEIGDYNSKEIKAFAIYYATDTKNPSIMKQTEVQASNVYSATVLEGLNKD